MTIYYVSNAASNGYALGNDSNDGLSPSTPFLTWAKAVTLGNNTYYGNPGIAYDENASGLNHGFTAAGTQTFSTDPTLLGVGNVIMTAAASDRIVNVATSSGAITFNNITFDGLSTSGQNAIILHNQTGGFFLNKCTFQHFTGGLAINGASGTGNIVAIDKCIALNTVPTFFIGVGGTYTSALFTGCTLSSTTVGIQFQSSATLTSLHVTKSVDGTQMTFNGSGAAVEIASGTITTMEIDNCIFDGTLSNGVYFPATGLATATNLLIHDNILTGTSFSECAFSIFNATSSNCQIYNNTSTSQGGLCNVGSENFSNTLIYNNTLTIPAGGTFDGISATVCTGILKIYNNTLTLNATATVHGILVGEDGGNSMGGNTNTVTAAQNMGDVSGNSYIDQIFINAAATQTSHTTYLGYVQLIQLKLAGTPVGNITCSLYTDSAGVPGTLVEASETNINANLLTSSYQTFYFPFTAHNKLTSSATYHLVFHYTGSVDGTNYVIFGTNTTVTDGSILKSTTGPGGSWVADTSHSIVYDVIGGMYNVTASVYGNTILAPISTSATQHGLLVAGVLNPSVYNNISIGSPVFGCKLCTGADFHDNLLFTSVGTQGGLIFKSSTNVTGYQNTIVNTATGASSCLDIESDVNFSAGNPPPCTGTFYNNILVRSGGGQVYGVQDAFSTLVTNYNDVWQTGGANVGIGQASWAGWQGSGNDTHSVNLDPLLSNEVSPAVAADFIPALTSPAKAIGINLNGAVPTDYLGNPFFIVPDVGAYSIQYNAQQILTRNVLVWNPFTSRLDYAGLTNSNASLLFSGFPIFFPTSASATVPSGYGNYTILVNTTGGAVTITLPPALGANGSVYDIKKVSSDGNNVTIAANGSDKIDGASTKVFSTQYLNVQIRSYGAIGVWEIL